MLVRLGGVVVGSRLLQYRAVAANLSGMGLISVTIPIPGLLLRSVAQAPRPIKPSFSEQQTPRRQDMGLQCLITKSVPDSSAEIEAEEDVGCDCHEARNAHQNYRSKSFAAAIREADYAATVQRYTHLPIQNPVCFMFPAIMFTNSLAMGVRNQVKPWVSTRYGWPLADVGYVLSAESFASVAVLFALPWLDRIPHRPPPGARVAVVQEAPLNASDSGGRGNRPEGEDLASAVRRKRKRELRVARASLGFGAAGALVIMLAASRAVFVLGLVVMTGAVGCPDAVRAFCTSFFAADDIQAMYAAVTVVETLGVIVGSPIWGWIFA